MMQYIAPQDLKSFGLIPEIIGRLPILTYLNRWIEMHCAAFLRPKKFYYQAVCQTV